MTEHTQSAGGDAIQNHAALIWGVADLLRGDYKQSEYGRVILPFVVLRRWDCVLAPVKADMLAQYAKVEGKVDPTWPKSVSRTLPRRIAPGSASTTR